MIQSSKLVHNELLLYEDSTPPVRFWLETLEPNQPVQRRDVTLWEELFCFEGWISFNGKNFQDSYLCLPPGELISGVKTTGGKASLLRLAYKANTSLERKSVIPIEILLNRERVWNEIPSRRQNDPGGRVTELFRNETGKQITSLMECRPGWVLEEHDHSSDVFPFCIRGGGRLGLGDQTITLSQEQLVRIPSRTRHHFETGQHGALFIIFVYESFTGNNT
jgi:quercetin dioxygenase-like cupin family protein